MVSPLVQVLGGPAVAVGADVVGGAVVAVGAVVGVGFTPPLWTLKCPRRVEVVPSDHFRTARIVCEPSASFEVSSAGAVPSVAVPAKSKGA
jgi:hypothetical protein